MGQEIAEKIKKKRKEDDKDVNIVKELLSLIIYIGVVILICYLIITFVGQRTTVHGTSMYPTLENGDNIWIDKIKYHFTDPKRFDVIVFPYQGDTYYIKRVIGLPGEKVYIDDAGNIFINGEKLDEDYGYEVIRDNGLAAEEITLGSDEYFVLGDNRNVSRDSRSADVGNVKKADIIGQAKYRLSPIKKFGNIDKGHEKK
jgi:signal peptidase I